MVGDRQKHDSALKKEEKDNNKKSNKKRENFPRKKYHDFKKSATYQNNISS